MATDKHPGFTVTPHLLHLHAGTVRAIVANFRQAADAGEAAALDHTAFGRFFAPLARGMDDVQLTVTGLLRREAAKLGLAATNVDAAADSYARLDADTAGSYRRMGPI
jgi:hypothetical protein